MILLGSLFVAHRPSLLISDITVKGTELVSPESVRTVVEQSLSGNYAWLYPKRHAWWYSAEAVADAVRHAFPQFSRVSVLQTAAAGLSIEVAEREAKYLYCLVSCYFMDASGFVFGPAASYSDHLFFEFGTRVAASTTPIGTTPLPAADFATIVDLRRRLELGLPNVNSLAAARLYRVEPLAEGEYQFLADWPSVASSSPFAIRFSRDDAAATIASSLLSAVTSSAFAHDWQEAPGRLMYLDARYLPKIFYKFAE